MSGMIKLSISLLAITILVGGCGGGDAENLGGASTLAIKVVGAQSFNPSISHGNISSYLVTIEGEGIPEPIEAEFSGDATEGVIENVPSGDNRIVSVRAINSNDVEIRAGEAMDVHVGSGINEVDIEMESVPIFTNLTDGNVIESSRLAMRIFADPDRELIIDDVFDGRTSGLFDLSSGLGGVDLDQSSGMGLFVPGRLMPGKHTFVVRDVETSRKTSVEAFVVSGNRRPAPLISAGLMSAGVCSRVVPMLTELP
jgi:hypothetical protein